MTEDRTTGDRTAQDRTAHDRSAEDPTAEGATAGGPSAGHPRPAPAPRQARAPHGPARGPDQPRPPLTTEDLRRLTLYKWRYSLESVGFTGQQVSHLLFMKWLYATNVVRD